MRLNKIRPHVYPTMRGETVKPEKIGLIAKNHAMWFIAHQIAKKMQQDGFPAVVITIFRSADEQAKLKAQNVTRALPWRSPHQYGEAADIVHAGLGWNVDPPFWEHLRKVGQQVSERYDTPLEFGYDWGWDSAHIEFADWQDQAWVKEKRKPTELETAHRADWATGEKTAHRFEDLVSQAEITAQTSNRVWRSSLCRYPGLVYQRFFNWLK